MEDDIKRWTAKRKAALVLDIIQGKTTISEASRAFDLDPSEVEQWVDEGKRGMENALRTKPLGVKEQYEKQLRELQEAYGEAMLKLRARKKLASLLGNEDEKCSSAFDMPRRTVYYRSTKAAPKVQELRQARQGDARRAPVLGLNNNTVQRIFQLTGRQVRKRPVGFSPRIQALPSVARAPEERWATDRCRVWTGRYGWASLALVIDCYSRELLGWHLSAAAGPRPLRRP